MRAAAAEILEIVRPVGRRKLVLTCIVLFAQSVLQLLAVFSALPFLSAAADFDGFRASRLGEMLLPLFGGDAPQRNVLVVLGLGSLALLAIGNAMLLFGTWYSARYSQQVGYKLRDTLVRMLLARRYEYFTGTRGSMVLKALGEDIGYVAQWVLLPALDIVSRALMVALLIFTVLWLEPLVSVIAVAAIALYYFAVVMPLRRAGLGVADQIRDATREIYFHVSETMALVKLVLVNNAEAHFADRIARSSLRLSQVSPRAQLYGTAPRVGFEVLVFGALILWVLALLLGGGDLVSNMPRIGLIAIVAYRLMPSLQLIFSSVVQISSLRQSLDEVLALLREQDVHAAGEARIPAAPPAALQWRHEIRFENVSFAYRGAGEAALSGLDFAIAKGSRVAFVGETGSGKSTLVDLLLGLLEPTGGRILIDGEPLTHAGLPAWRAALGYVPQDVVLLNASIAENIAFALDPDALDLDRVRRAAAEAHALEFIGKDGFRSEVGDRGVRLSGGQRQRLALARALYRRPSVLVLDEATSALDARTERAVMRAIDEMDDAITTVTVAHRLNTIEASDTIFFLEAGRIAASGSYDDLMRDVPAFRAFAAARPAARRRNGGGE